MKKRSLFLMICSALAMQYAHAQINPNIKPNIKPIQTQPIAIIKNPPVLNMGGNEWCKYDASARVKYIFYDAATLTPVTSRALPEANDYLSLFTVINGKEYTLVPSGNIGIQESAGAAQNISLVLSNGPRTANMPTGPAIWKVHRSGAVYTLSYSGAFANLAPDVITTGGYIGFQSGQVKIAGNGAGLNIGWQLQTVNEGGNNLIQLRNTTDNRYLGYTYSSGRAPTAGLPALMGNFAAAAFDATGCTSGTCGIKWYYKIYTGQKNTVAPVYRAPLEPNTYMVNASYDNKSLTAFGTLGAVFAAKNMTLDEEQWRFEPTTRGTYFIFSKKNNLALGLSRTSSKLIFAPVNTLDFYNSDSLQWVIGGPASGMYTMLPIVNRTGSNRNLLACKTRGVLAIEPPVAGSYFQGFVITPPNGDLWGYADMHTHPMSNFGFGEEFFFGAPDGDIATALGNCNCMHNFVAPPFDGNCSQQNLIRNLMIDKLDPHTKGGGYPNFDSWPKQSTTTHQQMWWEWLDRARKSGLRMIIALAQNSQTLADGMETSGPYDDYRSMNKQIDELIRFVRNHPAVMDTVTTADRMRSVVQSGRLAVIIGIEMDNIGNFYSPSQQRPEKGEVYHPNPTLAEVKAEIDRLYVKGVRYVFPIHIVNNIFGAASVYGDDIQPILFNLSNYYVTGHRFEVEPVSTAATGINFKYPDFSVIINNATLKAGVDFLRSIPGLPLKADVMDLTRYSYPDPGAGMAQRNKFGLTTIGQEAIKYMMSKGIMIDVDHMSEHSVSKTLELAMQFNYPVNSGHNGPRNGGGSEKTRTNGQYDTLRRVGGMVGVGTGDAEATSFVSTFRSVFAKTGGINITYGSDVGVGAKLPKAPSAAARLTGDIPGLDPCHTGNKTWDFNTYNTEGVDHYGMMPEFIKSLDRAGMTVNEKNALFSSTEYFVRMWEKCEINKRNVR
ncbi:MAG: membrane dipeptidase [Chitinophagaceae bacterium]